MATGTLKMKSDTGWITLNSTYGTEYRCVNSVVYIHCKYDGNISDGTRLGTLPAQYRPNNAYRFPNYNIGDTSSAIAMQIGTNGEVTILGAGNKWMNVSGSYPV